MVRSSEIDDCTMLFMFTSARTRARNYIQALPLGLSFLSTSAIPYNKKEEVEKPPLCDSLGVRTQDPNIKSVVLYQLS